MSKINPGLYSSASGEWETPQEFFDKLDEEFGFTLDPCATPENKKCINFFSKFEDGLASRWCMMSGELIGGGAIFVNPPYGREIGKWIAKSYNESRYEGSVIVMLIPARTDTAWWHNYVMKACEVRLIRGRLKFTRPDGHQASAPFPSAVVVFRSSCEGPPKFSAMERE